MSSSNAPLISSLSNEGDTIVKLILMFVGKLPGIMSEIKELYENSDWEELSLRIHALKGTAGNFGFLEVTEVTESIEAMIRDENFDEIKGLLIQLEGIQQRIMAGVASY